MIGTTLPNGKMPWADADGQRQKREQVIQAQRGQHSEKPAVVRKLIEDINGKEKSYIELFARRNPDAVWDCWGNEVGKLPDDEEAAA